MSVSNISASSRTKDPKPYTLNPQNPRPEGFHEGFGYVLGELLPRRALCHLALMSSGSTLGHPIFRASPASTKKKNKKKKELNPNPIS